MGTSWLAPLADDMAMVSYYQITTFASDHDRFSLPRFLTISLKSPGVLQDRLVFLGNRYVHSVPLPRMLQDLPLNIRDSADSDISDSCSDALMFCPRLLEHHNDLPRQPSNRSILIE